MVIVIIPTLASILSFFLKVRFQLKTKEQVDKIRIGVGKHLIGESAEDPNIWQNDASSSKIYGQGGDRECMAVSTFHRITLAAQLFRSWRGWPPAKQVKVVESAYCIRLLFCSNCVIKRVLFAWLGDEKLSFIPVLCIIFFGISMSLLVFFYLRYQAAVQLTKNHPKKETAEKLLSRLAILPARRSRKILYVKISVPQKAFKLFQLRADNS